MGRKAEIIERRYRGGRIWGAGRNNELLNGVKAKEWWQRREQGICDREMG